MNIDEFKLWFEGFVQAIESNNSSITKQQLEVLKEKVSKLSPSYTLPKINTHPFLEPYPYKFTCSIDESKDSPYDIIGFQENS